jgi:hypothetical protein
MEILRKPKVRLKYLAKKFKEWDKREHFVDSTSMLVEASPIFTLLETDLLGFANRLGLERVSDDVSLNTRFFVAAITYFGGMGSVYSQLRKVSRKKFKIPEKGAEGLQIIHDSIYSGAFNLGISPAIYFACGARDVKEIAFGTTIATGIGLLNGPLTGYAIDIGKDLTGLGKCERKTYPDLVRKRSPKIKKGLAALAIAASVASIGWMYHLTPNGENHLDKTTQGIEQIVQKE